MITLPLITPKLSKIKKIFKNNSITILDIGSGNQSARFTKMHLPNCKYYGLDIVRDYNYSSEDFNLMEKFYEKDLTRLEFDDIPNNFFDVIIMAHVIEHLNNGEDVILSLLSKLKNNGVFYLEYPNIFSTKLPSMKGTLNFYDDSSHVRVYKTDELVKILCDADMSIISFGRRRSWMHIFLMPFKLIYYPLYNKPILGPVFWDVLGFADYILFKKK